MHIPAMQNRLVPDALFTMGGAVVSLRERGIPPHIPSPPTHSLSRARCGPATCSHANETRGPVCPSPPHPLTSSPPRPSPSHPLTGPHAINAHLRTHLACTQVLVKNCVIGGLEEGSGYCVNCQVRSSPAPSASSSPAPSASSSPAPSASSSPAPSASYSPAPPMTI